MALSNAERQARHKQRLKAAADNRAHFIEWCRAQRESNQQQIDLFADGTLRTHERRAGGEFVDTTDATVANCRKIIAEMTRFIEEFERDSAA